MAALLAGSGRARAFLIASLLAAAAAAPVRADGASRAPASYRGPFAAPAAEPPGPAPVPAEAGPPPGGSPAAGGWRGPLLLGLGPGPGAPADPSPAALLARPHAILFDTAAFEPLADGEPDLSAFAPEPEGYEALAAGAPRLALVQFEAPPGPAERAALAQAGIAPLFAVPRHAYLVRADALALGRAAGLPGVRWVGRYRPGYKFDRGLARAAAGRPAPVALAGEGLDSFRLHALAFPAPGRTADDVAAAVAAAAPGVTLEGVAGDATVALLALAVPRAGLRAELARVAALEEVVALEPRGEIEFHNDDAVWIGQSYDRFWKRNYSKSATVWKRGLLGDGELIGIADSGVDPDVCWMIDDPKGLPVVSSVPADGALAGPIPVDPTRRKIVAYNLLGSFQAQATAYDVRTGDPHGTWAAVSAVGDDPTNPASESNPLGPHHDPGDGVAPLAKLVVEDLGDDKGKLVGLGLPVPLIVDRMFEQMRDAGARISTNSWGVARNEYDTLAFFTDRMVWNHPDFLIVFSAGNSGPFAGTLASPGTAKNVITVGASDARIQSDPDPTKALDPENVAEFSSRGPTSDGRLKPDLVMSGRSLVTGTSDRKETGRSCTTFEVNGTSFAAPLVAGYAALAREYYRKGFYPSGAARAADALTPSAALLKATLLAGARNMTGRGGPDYGPCVPDTCDLSVGLCFNGFGACAEDADCWTCSGQSALTCASDRDCNLALLQDDAPTSEQGWGRLQLDDALFFGGDTRGLAAWDVPRDRGVATGETWASEVYLDGRAEELKIVLTWTDPPALVASPSYLVNDLDLIVTAPNGTVYRGNAWAARDGNPATREATAPHALPASDNDNVEVVRLPAGGAPAGVWRVEVAGDSVPGTPFVDGGARQDFAVVAVGPVASAGGTLRFARPRFGCDGTAELEALDSDAGASLAVLVTTSSGDEETALLGALGGGRYAGGVALASGLPIVRGNGRLELADGDELTAVYQDASPPHAATARALAGCGQDLAVAPATFAGGCDGDGFLDAGETGALTLTLVNPGPADLRGVTATLRSPDPRLFVASASGSFGDIAVGASAPVAAPFTVSLRDGVPASSVTLELEVRALGWTVPRIVPVTIDLETDEVRTPGNWTESFTSSSGECYDGDPAPTPGAWYWFDVNKNCSTTEPTWTLGPCFGSRQALIPSCTGQLLSTASKVNHRMVSPTIVTGDPGSTTVLKSVRFRESFHLKLNEDGRACERTLVEVFTNRDGRTLPSGYYRDRSADGTDRTADLDPSRVAEWTLPPAPDATTLQLLFRADIADGADGSVSCTSSSGDEIRWRVDDVVVSWENVRRTGDATVCAPACVAPATPGGVGAAAVGDAVVVGWNAVAGAHHYDLWRVEGTGRRFVARVLAPETAALDRPQGPGPFTWEVEALDASGLCASAPAPSNPLVPPGACREAPAAPAALAASDAETAGCGVGLAWSAVASPCGGTVTYRVHRSTDPAFRPAPATLRAETGAIAFADSALTTGWDALGEPAGDSWTYEVRAVDGVSGLEGPGARVTVRAGGPRLPGTWLDDAGDLRPAKLVNETTIDETDAGAGWSRSPIAVHRSGNWSYWTDDEPLGTGRYAPLACFGLVGPELSLDATASPRLVLYANYSIEHRWDGMVVELSADGGPFAPIPPINGYPSTFANTTAPPCSGDGGGQGAWINGCDYPPTQGCITGPASGGLSGWRRFEFNLAAHAGRTIRFRINLSSDCGTDGGAVIDDVSVSGVRLPSACSAGPCWPPPRFSGLLSAEDQDPAAAGAVRLAWGEVVDWGGGGPGRFEVWRDGRLAATLDPSARGWDDHDAEPNRDHAYQVLARSGGGCDLPSASPATLVTRDCGALDPAQLDGARLTVDRSPDGEQVVLRCAPIPGAARYRFPWSLDPATVGSAPAALESGAPEARHPVLRDGSSYFYLVEDGPAPGCP